MPENKEVDPPPSKPKVKKTRVNIPWTPGEEQKLKRMRDNQNTWNEIAKVSCCLRLCSFSSNRLSGVPSEDRRECEEALV